VEVLVDAITARENVCRVARNSGWDVNVEDQTDGSYRLILRK